LLEVGDELDFRQATTINRRDLAKALSAFDEIWDVLFPAERERILGLLIKRIDFDAGRETVAITFRPIGIRSLADEVAMAPEAVR
jgi:hypothetical protein